LWELLILNENSDVSEKIAVSFFGFRVIRTRTWHGYRSRVMNGLGLRGGGEGEKDYPCVGY
jgi:hypothetical protein